MTKQEWIERIDRIVAEIREAIIKRAESPDCHCLKCGKFKPFSPLAVSRDEYPYSPRKGSWGVSSWGSINPEEDNWMSVQSDNGWRHLCPDCAKQLGLAK
jgi:hypothetical protein